MRIAYCILCHKYTPVLDALVDELSPGNGVYIHVDAKADIVQFAPLSDRATLIADRVDVRWGGFSLIEATLRLFAATQGEHYDYVSLVSGDTLPLRPREEIRRFFTLNRGREFVYEKPVMRKHLKRFKYEYPDTDLRYAPTAQKFRHAIMRRLGLYPHNRHRDTLPRLGFGSNWVTVTAAFRDYVFRYIADNPHFVEAFRHASCGDEHFFQTILRQSPFHEHNDRRRYMYVDWTTGPGKPRTLDLSDFGRLEQAVRGSCDDCFYLYARKFADDLDIGAYRKHFLEPQTHTHG